MPACEKCWGAAYVRSRITGRSQTECYNDILNERELNPCSRVEQSGQFWNATTGQDKRAETEKPEKRFEN
jgi:hypothetical protein